MSQIIQVQRTVQAILVPLGSQVMLFQNQTVSLLFFTGIGCTITLEGMMLYVGHQDLDALGLVRTRLTSDSYDESKDLKEQILHQCRHIYDPEIRVNIYDLGLIYNIECIFNPEIQKYDVFVTMTLTSPTCGMGHIISNTVKELIQMFKIVSGVNVDIVFSPVWTIDSMTMEAKLSLSLI